MLSSISNRNALTRFGSTLALLLASASQRRSDAFSMTVIPNYGNAHAVMSSQASPPMSKRRLDTSISAIAETLRSNAPTQQPQQQSRNRRPSESDLQHQLREMLDTDFVRRKDQVDEDELMTSTILPNLYRAQTVQDYKKIVHDGDRKLTVVHFSAPFCLACKASSPLVLKLAKEMPDINFVVFSVTKQNRHDVKNTLQVPSLPYAYVHHPTTHDVLEQLSTNKRHMNDFATVLESYRTKQCDLSNDVDADTQVFASPYARIQ